MASLRAFTNQVNYDLYVRRDIAVDQTKARSGLPTGGIAAFAARANEQAASLPPTPIAPGAKPRGPLAKGVGGHVDVSA